MAGIDVQYPDTRHRGAGGIPRTPALFCALSLLLGPYFAAAQSAGPGVDAETQLSNAVIDLLEAPPLPAITVSPTHRYALLVHQHGLLPMRALAEPMIEIAHLRVNPDTHGPHAPLSYFGLSQIDLLTNETFRIPLPPEVTIGFPRWSPDGTRFAFTVTQAAGIELWIGESGEQRTRRLLGPVLNAAAGVPCSWMPDGQRILCRTLPARQRATDHLQPGSLPRDARMRRLDESRASQVLEAQLELIDVLSGNRRRIGSPAAFKSVEPAPVGAFLLVRRISTPYVQPSDSDSSRQAVEVWDIAGHVARTFDAQNEPVSPRALQWHPAQPATLVWVENVDGKDRVVAQAPPFAAAPAALLELDARFSGLDWIADSAGAIVRDYDPATRETRVWRMRPGDSGGAARQLLASDSADARYATFGWPVHTTNGSGQQVIRLHDNAIHVQGRDQTDDGVAHFLDLMDLETGERHRIWQSSASYYEPLVDVLSGDGNLLLTQRESSNEPPNYVLHDVAAGTEERLTRFEHPASELSAARRIPLRYQRRDGRELSSTLYLPANASASDRLPLVMWAYPREFGSATDSVAGESPDRFPDFRRAFRLFFLLRGYGVMDDVSMPVIGDQGRVNDTFIEQIVDNASAALDAAAATGFVDPRRAGIAGHSYGAFMVANLLAHSRLFSAGVAMSGAYNRTLTPFGFQTERRTLWDAPEMYLAMSPLLFSNQIEAPLLLVHGLQDQNAGTLPIQSQQFYDAIRYNGGRAELLLLPLEGHSYRARESVLQTADAMLDWFNRYLSTGSLEPEPELASTAIE